MCGRTSSLFSREAVSRIFSSVKGSRSRWREGRDEEGRNEEANYQPCSNICPGRSSAILIQTGEIVTARFGLIASFTASDKKLDFYACMNARVETIKEKPTYRRLIMTKRCLVLLDGFYEWKESQDGTKGKQPYFIHGGPMETAGEGKGEAGTDNNKVMLLPAVYDVWRSSEGQELVSYSIITCEANQSMSGLHDRMPVVLNIKEARQWVRGDLSSEEVDGLLDSFHPSKRPLLHSHPVTKKVTNPSYMGDDCMSEVDINPVNKTSTLITNHFSKAERESDQKGSSSSSSSRKSWTCNACTLENSHDLLTCMVCDTARGDISEVLDGGGEGEGDTRNGAAACVTEEGNCKNKGEGTGTLSWTCDACTLINEKVDGKCQACGASHVTSSMAPLSPKVKRSHSDVSDVSGSVKKTNPPSSPPSSAKRKKTTKEQSPAGSKNVAKITTYYSKESTRDSDSMKASLVAHTDSADKAEYSNFNVGSNALNSPTGSFANKKRPATLEAALFELDEVRAELEALKKSSVFNKMGKAIKMGVLSKPGNKDRKDSDKFDEEAGLLMKNDVPKCHMAPTEASYSLAEYLDRPVISIMKQRLPWLVGLLIFQSFSAIILGSFEALLEKHLVIGFFVPMIVGTGGNAGNQPGVMITRALGAKEVNQTNLRQIFIKEFKLAALASAILGTVSFLRVIMSYPEDAESAVAIALTIALVVMVSVFLGLGFSLLLDRLNIDPADAAALLLTSLADMLGILILCLISSMMLAAR